MKTYQFEIYVEDGDSTSLEEALEYLLGELAKTKLSGTIANVESRGDRIRLNQTFGYDE